MDTTLSGASANSYATLAQADEHHADRATASWAAADDAAKEAALIRATDFIDSNYIFRSVPATDEQALENPRDGEDTLQPRLVKATAMLANILLTDDPVGKDTAAITSETKSLDGVGSTSTTYAKRPSDPYPEVTKTLGKLANRRGASASNMVMR